MRIAFPPISNYMFLISVWNLIKMAFVIHISMNIGFMALLAFSKKIYPFSAALLLSFWAFTGINHLRPLVET